MLAAGDTFRAAAVEQLQIWGERAGCRADAARDRLRRRRARLRRAEQGAEERRRRSLLIDTAGRLHNKADLMAELQKMRRIVEQARPGAPQAVLLVLDATTGQNGLTPGRSQFAEAVGVTGIVITKLDGTAKGGILVALAERFGCPSMRSASAKPSTTCNFLMPKPFRSPLPACLEVLDER